MSHPLLWPPITFFYPIGNTSAVCLTQELAPEQAADVLLLGCGDPRNVLFTLYADLKLKTGTPRKLDVTCCDYEPAVLARNVLLYSLLMDDENVDVIWNIFYHFFIDEHSHDVLVKQCRKLHDASTSVDVWSHSKYGHILKMCTNQTLSELRRHWLLYADFRSLPVSRKERLDEGWAELVRKKEDESGVWTSIVRSAAMASGHAIIPVNAVFKQYWTTGTTFNSAQAIQAAALMNPTFAYSLAGEAFIPHYGTFPAQAFHLFPAFVPVTDNTSEGSTESFMTVVRHQFNAWSAAFKRRVKESSRSLALRFCVADVLSACHALARRQVDLASPAAFVLMQWSTKALDLDGPIGPTRFDIIDTSNLMDHLGLLNILLATEPLLKREPTSTMYTEAMLSFGDDPAVSFLERICGDASTMSIILDLAPRAMLSGFQTQSMVHEIFMSLGSDKQFHERFAWCRPARDTRTEQRGFLVSNSYELGHLIFQIYNKMFDEERLLGVTRNANKAFTVGHYTRATFAYLVRLIKSHLSTTEEDWDRTMDVFHQVVIADQERIIAMHYYQDLFLQLHLHGLHTTPNLSPSWNLQALVDHPVDIFRGWTTVPPVVCVILVVPHKSYSSVLAIEGVNSVPLHCSTRHGDGTISFFQSTLQAAPGRLDVLSEAEPPSVRIQEDPRGFSALGDVESLVVSFLAPAWVLTKPGTIIALALQTSPLTVMKLLPILGMDMEIFSASITNRQHVYIVPERPNIQKEIEMLKTPSDMLGSRIGSATVIYTVQMDSSCSAISTITAKVDLRAAHNGVPLPPNSSVSAEHTSPCSITLRVDRKRTLVSFPYPVKGDDHKLRIARKSLYVEIIVAPSPYRRGLSTGGYFLNPFQVVPFPYMTPWSIHNIYLDVMPALNIAKARSVDLDWVNAHTALQLSDREKAIRNKVDCNVVPAGEVFISIKDSLHMLFCKAVGINPPSAPIKIFQLHTPDVAIFMLLFVTNVRLDPASFTIVADTAVVPLDISIMPKLDPGLRALVNGTKSDSTMTITATLAEAQAWKKLLPAYVERCRTWSHGPNCEYRTASGRIPLTLELDRSPICSCGLGRGLPDVLPGVPAAAWKHLRPFATRAAISPLFAVSYVDRVAGGAKEMHQTMKEKWEKDPPSFDPSNQCAACGGPGKPKLQVCGRCKTTKYCSKECSKVDWKSHKLKCRSA